MMNDYDVRRVRSRFGSAGTLALLGVIMLAPALAGAVACPSGFAKVDVCVYNPTGGTSPTITVSGQYITNQITCTGPSAPIPGSYSASFTVPAGQTYCTPGGIPAAGVVSGMFVHRIQVGATTQNQYQKRPVLASSTTRTRVDWTYMPNVITVNVTGDAGSGSCPVNSVSSPPACDVRNAVAAATSVGGTLPVLIQFTASPGIMLGVNLRLLRANLTLDGTDANGNPWIVGDPNAAGAGNQDPFPRVLELNPGRAVWIEANNVTLKGLEVSHLNGLGSVSLNHLINQFAPFTGTRFDSTRLDARNTVNCNVHPEDCEGLANLVNLQTRATIPLVPTLTMFNVEASAAMYQGMEAASNNDVRVQKSWLRNNYYGNIRADSAKVRLEHSVIERAGLRPPDDLGMTMTSTARGVHLTELGAGAARLETEASIIRNNRSFGLEATGLGDVVPEDDAYCGNGATGLRTAADINGDIPSLNSFGGLAAVYNSGNGVRVAQDDFVAASLRDDSAFASNSQCGLFNEWPTDSVLATNNQWRFVGVTIPDTCAGQPGAGPVDVDPVQDPNLVPITISSTFPSNVILKGQTIQVMGSGFSAITGNPLAGAGNCTVGVTTNGAGQAGSCCNKTTRANTCAGVNQPVDGGGNCVELRSGTGTWVALPVKAVTPRMIEAQVATNVFTDVFGCLGASNELVRVSKRSGSTILFNTGSYCTNAAPL